MAPCSLMNPKLSIERGLVHPEAQLYETDPDLRDWLRIARDLRVLKTESVGRTLI